MNTEYVLMEVETDTHLLTFVYEQDELRYIPDNINLKDLFLRVDLV